jgi:hypothetical protein
MHDISKPLWKVGHQCTCSCHKHFTYLKVSLWQWFSIVIPTLYLQHNFLFKLSGFHGRCFSNDNLQDFELCMVSWYWCWRKMCHLYLKQSSLVSGRHLTDGGREWVKYIWSWHIMWQIRNMESEDWFMVSKPRRLLFGQFIAALNLELHQRVYWNLLPVKHRDMGVFHQ